MAKIPLLGHKCEDDLLFCCASTQTGPEIRERIEELLSSELSWAYLVWKGYRYDLLPLLYRQLYPTYKERIPGTIMGMLADAYRGILVPNSIIAAEIAKVIQLLADESIPSIAVKGPASVVRIYGNLALQRCDTPIFLIHRQDQRKANLLLTSQGYAACQRPGGINFKTNRGTRIKFRWELTSPFYPAALDLAKLWPRKICVSLFNNKAVFYLGAEDLILSLCEQGAKNDWNRMKEVLNLGWLIGKQDGIDWDWTINQARTLNCKKILFTGVLLANKLLGTILPAEVLHRAMAIPAVKAEAEKTKGRILRTRPPQKGSFERHIFHLRMRDRLPDRILYALKIAPEIAKESLYKPFRRLIVSPSERVGFLPTPQKVVEHMLAMARVGPADLVCDIGCGDGRIVTTAARLYGAHGLGIDINPKRIAQSAARACEEGVDNLVSFVCKDAAKVDLSPVTVVTLYLSPSMNEKLGLKLCKQLPSGARIISHDFDFGNNCPPHKIEFVNDGNGHIVPIHLWQK